MSPIDIEHTSEFNPQKESISISDPHSPQVQQQAERCRYESMSVLWKNRLTPMPTTEQIQGCMTIHGLRNIPRSSLTHYGPSTTPREYFIGDDIAVTISEHHDYFENAGDEFCTELGEPPADDRSMLGMRRCGFQIEVGECDETMANGQGESMIDFGIVRWHEIPATVTDAVQTVRNMIRSERAKVEAAQRSISEKE